MRAYERVQKARALGRPTSKDFIGAIFSDFFELHGDRLFGDDKAIVGGLAYLGEMPVTVIGIEKGSGTDEKVMRNFGSAHPEGYRKAIRLMAQAEKFRRPVICFVDTAGAYCGIGAEERGQGSAIAQSLVHMAGLTVPVISAIIGEGGSGGALALAVSNEIWMLENAVFSVISPEGAASILYKDASKAAQASEDLKLTAQDLLSLGIVEKIVSENEGVFDQVYKQMKKELLERLAVYSHMTPDEIRSHRYGKFRAIGRAAE